MVTEGIGPVANLIGRAWEAAAAMEGHDVEPELRQKLDEAITQARTERDAAGPARDLRERVSDLVKVYRSRQEVHARKAGYQGMNAEREYVYDMVAVDLERVLAGEKYLTENEHGHRRIYNSVSKGVGR